LDRGSVLDQIVFNQVRVSSWCMRLLNARGAKAPRRVLIPAIDGSVPRRSCSGASGPARRRGVRVMLARIDFHARAAAAWAIAGEHAGSSLRPTISSLFCHRARTANALGGTL
jgi:hypothetical protein